MDEGQWSGSLMNWRNVRLFFRGARGPEREVEKLGKLIWGKVSCKKEMEAAYQETRRKQTELCCPVRSSGLDL